MKNRTIINKLGITLNAMQEATSDAILHTNKDIVVLSPTGSGKSYAYMLPLIEQLNSTSDLVQAAVVLPSRELALQSANVLKDLGSGLRSMALYGGRTAMDEHKKLREINPQIIFATPGRLNDHLEKGNISINSIEWLVIDEFDKCLELGFQDEMSAIFGKLPNLKRRILLSATESELIPSFVSMGRMVKVDYQNKEEKVSDRIKTYIVRSPQMDKLDTLCKLLLYLGESSTIVFLNYRESVERVASYLEEKGFSLSLFHGGLDQNSREAALYRFSNGSVNILISTNLASRGLDIPDVQNIVHYHMPETEDDYTHRIGRTARWKNEGSIYFLLNPNENLLAFVKNADEELTIPTNLPLPAKPKMGTVYIGKGKKDKISKIDIVGFFCKIGGLTSEEIGKIDIRDRYTYVAVKKYKISQLLKNTKGEKIKGIRTIVEEIR